MKLPIQHFTVGFHIAGLSLITIVEAIRPGTIGAAMNLGVVVFFGSLGLSVSILTLSKKYSKK